MPNAIYTTCTISLHCILKLSLISIVLHLFSDVAASNYTTSPAATSSRSAASALFRPSRSRFSTSTQKRGKKKTWTGTFLCMADKNTVKVPNSTEKIVLQKAGLGVKRIQFSLDDNPETVVESLKNEFPKLKQAGGIELLRCEANCRMLKIIDCEWSAASLRSCVGSQAKIYIRPIQTNVSVEINNNEISQELRERCVHCGEQIDVRDLRTHSENCVDPEMVSLSLLFFSQ